MAGHNREPILIAGGGVGGLATAIAASRAGREVEVFERAPQLAADVGTAFNLWGNGVTALQAWGLQDAIAAVGDPIERMELLDRRGRHIADTPIGEIGARLGTRSYSVPRADLLSVLAEAAAQAGARIHTGCGVVGHGPSENGVRVELSDGTQADGAVLVGADGARSAVRRDLVGDGDTVAGSLPVRGISTVDPGAPAGTVLMVWGDRGGGAGCWPLLDGRVAWTVGTTARLRRRIEAGDAVVPAVLAFVRDFPPIISELVRATAPEAIVTSPVQVRTQGWVRRPGPVTLLGDAAHAMPTVFSQGACQALEDAAVLGDELAAVDDPVAALRSYEDRRGDRIGWLRKKVFGIDRMQRFESRVACAMRDSMMRHAPADRSTANWEQLMTFGSVPVS